jgi:hypothetical protein
MNQKEEKQFKIGFIVCLLSLFHGFMVKPFEKMVCDKLTPVIRSGISDAQHGILKVRSTVTNLVEFSNSFIGEMEMDVKLMECTLTFLKLSIG